MSIFAIDPGPEQSGYVVLKVAALGRLSDAEIECATLANDAVLERVLAGGYQVLVVEMIETWGMAVGKSVFEALWWMGRFHEAAYPHTALRITRKNVMLQITGRRNAKPGEMREAMLDLFGPGKQRAIGTKKAPGPLYHIRGHQWAALALAVAQWKGTLPYEYLNTTNGDTP